MDEQFLRDAHKHSIRNHDEIQRSALCGCFHCQRIFPAADVTTWIEENPEPNGSVSTTGWCPHCGIDALIGDASGFQLDSQFLARMRKLWFW